MAILNGLIRKMSGSAGDFTFKQLNGQTVVSEKVTRTSNPRSTQQMQVRTRWNNVLAMYKGMRYWLKDAYESKSAGVNDYNMFMKFGMRSSYPVYLTKQQVAEGACVAAPYQFTQGSLPAIVISGDGQSAVTDISLGSDNITASTTVAQFSKAVVDNNPDFKYGDQISYFLVKQKVNADTSIPYCQFSSCKVVLDAANTTDKLWDVVIKNGFTSQDGCLGHGSSDGDCVYGWCHTRKSDGKLLVSSQNFVNANTKLADYTTELAFNLAASSYGTSKDVFLSPDVNAEVSAGGGSDAGGGGGGGDSL